MKRDQAPRTPQRAQTTAGHARQSGLQRAIDQMVSGGATRGADGGQDGLLCLGEWQKTHPAVLGWDPVLSSSAKVLYIILHDEMEKRPYGVLPMPAMARMLQAINASKPTLLRDLKLLRITRWISLCRRVRDSRGRFRGNVYLLHGEPCSLAEQVETDLEYMQLLEECAAHRDSFLRRAAQGASRAIDEDIAAGLDPLEPPDRLAQRMDAAGFLGGAGTRFYAIDVPPEYLNPDLYGPAEILDPVAAADAATEALEPASDKIFSEESPPDCHVSGPAKKSLPGEAAAEGSGTPGKKSLPGEDESHPIDSTNVSSWRPAESAGTPALSVSPCSSSIYINTTTTEENPIPASAADLDWPAVIPSNARHLALRAMAKERPPTDLRQAVVHALAWGMASSTHPVRNVFTYTQGLCRRARAGTLEVLPPPAPPTPAAGERDPKGQVRPGRPSEEVREMRGQIRTLETLRDAPGTAPAVRDLFERQIEALRERLRGRVP